MLSSRYALGCSLHIVHNILGSIVEHASFLTTESHEDIDFKSLTKPVLMAPWREVLLRQTVVYLSSYQDKLYMAVIRASIYFQLDNLSSLTI